MEDIQWHIFTPAQRERIKLNIKIKEEKSALRELKKQENKEKRLLACKIRAENQYKKQKAALTFVDYFENLIVVCEGMKLETVNLIEIKEQIRIYNKNKG
jgi:hypothetical protein